MFFSGVTSRIVFNFRYCDSCQRRHCLEKIRMICTYDLRSQSNILKRSYMYIYIYIYIQFLVYFFFFAPIYSFLYCLFFIHTCQITSPCLYTQTAEDRDIDLFYPVSAISVVRDMEKKLCLREVMYVIKGTAVPSFS